MLLAFLLPIWPRLIPFVVAAQTLNWAISGNIVNLFKTNSSHKYFLLFISLYVLYLVGLLFTENMDSGLQLVTTKLSLLVFPLIYFSSPVFNTDQFKKILKALVFGCLVTAFICVSQSTYNYFSTKYALAHGSNDWDFGINWFLKDRISIWMHPSYRAMYFLMALMGLNYYQDDFVKSIGWRFFIYFILSFLIVLFGSKAGIISLLLFGLFAGWQLVFKEKKVKQVVIGTAASLLIFFSLYIFAPQFALRINDAWKAVSGNVDVKKSDESTAARMSIWSASKIVIGKNILFGVGTGDVEIALLKEYEMEGMKTAYDEKLNTHNQYLQTTIALGMVGFIILVLSLLAPLVQAIKKRNQLYVLFLLLFIINILVESMLETQAGVIFFAFFNSLIFTQYSKEKI